MLDMGFEPQLRTVVGQVRPCVCMCVVCVCVCVCMCVCVRARARSCVCVCTYASVHLCVSLSAPTSLALLPPSALTLILFSLSHTCHELMSRTHPHLLLSFSQVRHDRQTLMFTATWPIEVQSLAQDFLRKVECEGGRAKP